MLDIDKYIKTIPVINTEKEYWFVRTNSGDLYNNFKEGGFIAIGWNYITVNDIVESLTDDSALRMKIIAKSKIIEESRAENENDAVDPEKILDLKRSKDKSKITTIINKLQTFYQLKKGDVIVIPNKGSSRFCFGVVADDHIDLKINGENNCAFFKRRNINWITEKSFLDIGTAFFSFKKNMHSISSVKSDMAYLIDKVMNDIYFKDNELYYKVKVDKTSDIKASDLFFLGSELVELLAYINQAFGFNEDINETVVKINVQSKGDFLFRSNNIGKSLAVLSLVLSLASCGGNTDDIIKDQEQQQRLENVKNRMTNLDTKVHRY